MEREAGDSSEQDDLVHGNANRLEGSKGNEPELQQLLHSGAEIQQPREGAE